MASDLENSLSAIDFNPSLRYPNLSLSLVLHLCLINLILDSSRSTDSPAPSRFSFRILWGLFSSWDTLLYLYSDFWVQIRANIRVLSSQIFSKFIALLIFILSSSLLPRDSWSLQRERTLLRDFEILRDWEQLEVMGWVKEMGGLSSTEQNTLFAQWLSQKDFLVRVIIRQGEVLKQARCIRDPVWKLIVKILRANNKIREREGK